MKMKVLALPILLTSFFFISSSTYCQSITRHVVANLGHFYSNSTGSLSATLGEPMTETFNGPEHDLTQGFQQSSFRFTSIKRKQKEEQRLWVFPNPVQEDRVRVRSQKGFPENTMLRVRNIQGKLLYRTSLQGQEELVDLSDLSSGSYIFRIIASERILGTYRVEKVR